MLDEIGKEYLVEHAVEEYKAEMERKSFEYFNSEMLRSMNNNLAKAFGGMSFPKSYQELEKRQNAKPETRSAGEIKKHMLDKLKALGGEE